MNAPRKPTLLDVCRFLRRHAPGLVGGRLKGLAHWIGWYWCDARIGIVRSGESIVAVALARCLDRPEQAEEPYFHNEAGQIVWVQDVVSCHPEGLSILLLHAIQRFGPREAFAGRVFHRAGELRMIPWKTVQRFLTGGHHGLSQHAGTAAAA